jgi:hypothetical protein
MAQTAISRAHISGMRGLRELGVYALPDGSEYVASTIYSGRCCLYSPPAWCLCAGAELRVDARGRLLRRDVPTWWYVDDLKDTGRTARYPSPVIA